MSTDDHTGGVTVDDHLTQVAMRIILAAGEARSEVRRVYEALSSGDTGAVGPALAEAKERITTAHRAQTEVIQAEARGERHEPTLLFAHAQDTLMVVNSEVITARHVAGLVDGILTRLARLEAHSGASEPA